MSASPAECPFCGMIPLHSVDGMVQHPATTECALSTRMFWSSLWNKRVPQPLPQAFAAESYAVQLVALIDMLRRDKGHVTFFEDNPHSPDHERCEVKVSGAWNDCRHEVYVGRTVLAALTSAFEASREKKS